MSDATPDPDVSMLVVTVRTLTKVIGDLGARFARQRLLLRLAFLSLALDVCLSVATVLIVVRVQHNTRAALQQCLAGNEFRKADLARWLFIERLPQPPPRTPEERAQQEANLKATDANLRATDAPRDCSKV